MAEQSYGDWIRSNPPLPTKEFKKQDMAQMTAAEWLIEQISEKQSNGLYVIDTLEDVKRIFEQAKQMEKEQIMEAYGGVLVDDNGNIMSAEDYYNDTYTQSGTKQV